MIGAVLERLAKFVSDEYVYDDQFAPRSKRAVLEEAASIAEDLEMDGKGLRIRRAFQLYKRLKQHESTIAHLRPDGRFGIAIDDDPLAREYQQRVAWRIEVVEAFFLGRSPNPYVKRWYRPPQKET
jgi:hypothetical protein